MKNNKPEQFPIPVLRETLRQRANTLAAQLSRSVARLTSCDPLPCLEYGDEVKIEHSLAEKLFYIQHCRNALEHCIAGKGATLRYRWSDGSVTRTTFRKAGPNRVKAIGLLPQAPGKPK